MKVPDHFFILLFFLLASSLAVIVPTLAAPSLPSPVNPVVSSQVNDQLNACPLSVRPPANEQTKLTIPGPIAQAQTIRMVPDARSNVKRRRYQRKEDLYTVSLHLDRAQSRVPRGEIDEPVRMRRRVAARYTDRAAHDTRRSRVHPSAAAEFTPEPESNTILEPFPINQRLPRAKRQDEPIADDDGSSSESSDSDSASNGESSDSDDASSSGDGEGESNQKEGEVQLDPSGGQVSTISSETRTIEFDEGQSVPTAGVLTDPTGRQGELKLTMMWETVNEFDTDIGKMTEKCLTPFDDPSQKFCETSLNGVILGSGVGNDRTPNEVQMLTTTTSTPEAAASTESTSVEAPPITTEAVSLNSEPPTTLASPPSATVSTSASPVETSPPINTTISDIGAAPIPISTESVTKGSDGSVSIPVRVSESSTASTSVDPSSAGAAAASEEAATVEIPGQKLQVLPIGLGIFGAVAGIAILVVLYVTYQRRKYKKQFRDRTNALAEKVNRLSTRGGYGSA